MYLLTDFRCLIFTLSRVFENANQKHRFSELSILNRFNIYKNRFIVVVLDRGPVDNNNIRPTNMIPLTNVVLFVLNLGLALGSWGPCRHNDWVRVNLMQAYIGESVFTSVHRRQCWEFGGVAPVSDFGESWGDAGGSWTGCEILFIL